MSDPPPPAVALRPHRERTIERLCAHFAREHLGAEELERRVERAHRAGSVAELDALLADLPPLDAAYDREVVAGLMDAAERRQLQRGEPRDGSGWVGGPRR